MYNMADFQSLRLSIFFIRFILTPVLSVWWVNLNKCWADPFNSDFMTRLEEEKILRACSDLIDTSKYKRDCTRCTNDTLTDCSGHIWSLLKSNVATLCEQCELERVLYHNEEQLTPVTSRMKQVTITKDYMLWFTVIQVTCLCTLTS